jgi:hypothetical protein
LRSYFFSFSLSRRLFLAVSDNDRGLLLEQLTAAHQGLGGINASGYISDKTRGLPWGTVIRDGTFLGHCDSGEKHTMGGFNAAFKLVVGRFTDVGTGNAHCRMGLFSSE